MSWHKAKDAAWRAFGTRYWRWIVGFGLVGRALPALGFVAVVVGMGAAVTWAVRHVHAPRVAAPQPSSVQVPSVPHVSVWWWVAGVAFLAVVGAGWAVWRWFHPAMPSYGGSGRRWVAAALTAIGLAVAVWVWRT